MHLASPITDRTAAQRPAPEPVTSVDVRLAAGLLANFITAMEMEASTDGAAMICARGFAERHLAEWGVA